MTGMGSIITRLHSTGWIKNKLDVKCWSVILERSKIQNSRNQKLSDVLCSLTLCFECIQCTV